MAVVMAMAVVALMVGASHVSAAGTVTIADNATGGGCSTVGTWDSASKTCTLSADYAGTIGIVDDGITLDGAGHTLTGPRLNGGLVFNTSGVTVKNLRVIGFYNGILISGGSGNTLINNTLMENDYGIYVDASEGNIIRNNSIAYNTVGMYVEFSSNNTIFNNRFEVNGIQASVLGGSGNAFNITAPTGGNFWDDFDEPADGCVNGNGDEFCDSAYVFTGGVDNLPHTASTGWCGKPGLRLYKSSVFWASFADYTARQVSVTYSLKNKGDNAYGVSVTGSSATNGATCITSMPLGLGDISGGSAAGMTLKYQVPAGVGGFVTTTAAVADDGCGASFIYP